MVELGYATLSEEHGPMDMVEHVAEAEQRGIPYAMVSDHYHPWIDAQGESPFVWGVLGAIAQATEEITIGTAVTAPIIRIHPAVIAQAAATAACQLPGRFVLGVGTGENLNEHVAGDRWPPHDVRLEMLTEAIDVIRTLWDGGSKTHRGDHYTVENARVYTLPAELPPIVVAAGGERSATAAGRIGDGLMATAPEADLIETYEGEAEADANYHGQTHVCYAEDEDAAIQTAYEQWPNAAITGELGQELRTPAHFEQAAEMLEPEDVAETVVCGADADEYIETIEAFVEAGFDRVHLHQVGDDQSAFLEFYTEEVMPSFD